MSWTRRPALAALALVAAACAGEPGPERLPDPETLRVVSWNVQFLPGLAARQNRRKDAAYRARRIVEEVRSFDLVALQETFDTRRREEIVAGLTEAWGGWAGVVESPKPEGFTANGGCLLLTRRPVLATHSMVFTEMSSPKDYGLLADGFAAKGAIHARLAREPGRPDDFVDVYVTHLEARDGTLRPSQYRELAAFVRETSDPGAPVLLLGDLNTYGGKSAREDPDSQYAEMLAILGAARPDAGLGDLWPALRGEDPGGTTDQSVPGAGARIDYALLGGPLRKGGGGLVPVSIEVEPFRDPKVTALSDHSAVQATFRWNPR